MGRIRAIGPLIVTLLGLLVVPGGAAASAADAEEAGYATGFRLEGSNGYSILVDAYSEPGRGRGFVGVLVHRPGSYAGYRVPATVSPAGISADLGRLGRIEVTRHPSGHVKRLRSKCVGGSIPFEPARFEGTIRFRGERGYVRVSQSVARERSPLPLGDCSGGGRGESVGGGLPGARLEGRSFAHGRVLRFQFNKNRPRRAKTVYSASLAERRGRLRVFREVHGAVGSTAFSFAPDLSSAALEPPAPFSGRATLRRDDNSVYPFLTGNLAVHFPGRTVRAVGRSLAVGLVHARFTISDGPFAEAAF
ncbi:MAG: hypothetical protein R2725_10250 [Solirubrobacterales bacterium]